MKRFCSNLIVKGKIITHSKKCLGRQKNVLYLEEEQILESMSQKKEWPGVKLMKKGDPSQPRGELRKHKEPSSTLYR